MRKTTREDYFIWCIMQHGITLRNRFLGCCFRGLHKLTQHILADHSLLNNNSRVLMTLPLSSTIATDAVINSCIDLLVHSK